MIRIDDAGYPIWIGDGILEPALRDLPEGRFFLVSDRNVEEAGWLARAAAVLAPRLIGKHILRPGEESKDFSALHRLLDAMLEARMERTDYVVAVGGGLVGDLAGLAASLLKRGCGLIQVPTTLLAQADAAVGGKTGINARQGKNLIGAFHQPAAVIIDIATLATLPGAELRSGYAEVVKYGLIGDAPLFGWCEANGAALLAGDPQARLHAVATAVRAKLAAVKGDERDTRGVRALLNFGHSFGHAIETETGLRHGEAVAIGMVLAFRLSVERAFCPSDDAERVAAHLQSVGLPTRARGLRAAALVERMAHDKKRRGGALQLIL
ncbi:MAG TPA: 3-dehydroquinate synthase, partial [Allosphingosinicella sp.]|nr:3-dehydroquinate synthase [Allosphingosinicella sp.]